MKRTLVVVFALLVVVLLAGVSASPQIAKRGQPDNANGNYNPTYDPNQIAILRWYQGNAKATTFSVPPNSGMTTSIAFDGANMWVSSYASGMLTELSINGQVLASISLGGNPNGLVYDGANIWVANSTTNAVHRVNVATHQLTTFTLPAGSATNLNQLAFDGQYIWATGFNKGGPGKVSYLDRNGVVQSTIPVGNGPAGIAFDGDCMWIVNARGGDVWVLGVPNHNCLFTGAKYNTGASYPNYIAYDGSNMWVAANTPNVVVELDDVFGTGVLQTISVAAPANGVVFDGAYIWVANAGSNSIWKLLASNSFLGTPGTIVGQFPVQGGATQVAFDGANVWATLNSLLVQKF